MKKNTITPIRKPAPAAPEFRPRFSPEGLDLLINRVVEKSVAVLRARAQASVHQRRRRASAE